jgi:predicted nucleic acid-binding protein
VKAFVLDASLALEWFAANASKAALAKRALLDDHVAVVPHLWRYEVMNAVTTWQRRGSISSAESVWILSEVIRLPYAIVDEGDPTSIVSLAAAYRLSAYDASYLHVAMITGEPIATLDVALRKAARTAGVQCL